MIRKIFANESGLLFLVSKSMGILLDQFLVMVFQEWREAGTISLLSLDVMVLSRCTEGRSPYWTRAHAAGNQSIKSQEAQCCLRMIDHCPDSLDIRWLVAVVLPASALVGTDGEINDFKPSMCNYRSSQYFSEGYPRGLSIWPRPKRYLSIVNQLSSGGKSHGHAQQ